MMEEINLEKSEIRQFYNNTKVFITGATGFVGKTLIEKLLRVTNVHTIYVLIREKKGKTVADRLTKIFQNPVFNVLKAAHPNFQRKIKPVLGECGIPGLVVSDTDRKELISNVNVIFHAAATVNFDENLKSAYDINVCGSRSIINMAKEMKGLKSLIFVSTAYSNCIRNLPIKEEVYDYPYDEVIEKLDALSKEAAESAQKKIIGEWPNTYTFTKALSEILFKRERQNLPIGIFRPSIITSTYKEPIPGWIDNIYGINGIALGLMTGFLRVYRAKGDASLDAVPVDMCISAMLAAAKEISEAVNTESDIFVYNYTCHQENPVTYDLFRFLNIHFGVPTSKAIWYPSGIFIPHRIIGDILSFLLQIIPAFLMDFIAVLTGNKPQLVSLYGKALKFGEKMRFFGERGWQFDNTNVRSMWKRLSKTDQELFPFSMSAMSWVIFCGNYSLGLRRYILKEDDNMLDRARVKFNRLYVAHCVLKVLTAYVIFFVINVILSKLCNIVFS